MNGDHRVDTIQLHKIMIANGLPLLAYLLGSIPWGLFIARHFSGIDITKQGSGNIGATNVGRLAGFPLGLLTLVLDMVKGFAPVYIALAIIDPGWVWREGYIAFVALAAFLGHLYPVYLKFKNGGKGVATAFGCFVVISPGAGAIIMVLFLLTVWASKRVSVGSLMGSAVLPVAVWLVTESSTYGLSALAVGILIFIRHKDNIKRLLTGTEPPFPRKPPR